MGDPLPDRVRLGDFEIDLRAGEVRSDAGSGRLQEKSLRVLILLIEHSGDLVTRDEIQRRLWPNDTIVDFENGINTAVKRLRQALDDSADNPRYIENIPRRGYRLLVPVEPVRTNGDSEVLQEGAITPAEGQSLLGKKVSHYRVLEVIGGGGMGLVYKAEDLKLGRQVALKFLPPELASDAVALQRFEREARAASSFDHANICTVHAVDEYEGQPFIVMQLLEGETLRDRLARLSADHELLPLNELLSIGVQVCEGLQAAHDKGIVHRDIKPANIFITSGGQAKILDFGLAKLVGTHENQEVAAAFAAQVDGSASVETTLTRTGTAIGTAGYMSPEQVRRDELDARTDIFSFGLVLYEMAAGQRAFTGDTAADVQNAILNDTPTPLRDLNSGIPDALPAVIDKALEKDRNRRYPSASLMRTELLCINADQHVHAPARPKRFGRLLLASCAIAFSIVGALYWYLRSTHKLRAGDTIVIADFENNTSDPAFTEALKFALETELAQTPFIDVLGSDKIHHVLKQVGRSEGEKLTPATALEVCERTNSAAVVAGSIADEGNKFRLSLIARDCQEQRVLATSMVEVKSRDLVVRSLGALGSEIRRKLGEPSSSVRQFNKPLDEATSSSIEALQSFEEGNNARMLSGTVTALPLYEQAVKRDPNFAVALAYLGIMHGNNANGAMEDKYLRRAFDLRNHVTERDRYAIEASYYHLDTGELDKAISIYREWLRNYPRDRMALINFGIANRAIGNDEQAAALFKESIRLDPLELIAYENLIAEYVRLNQPKDALDFYNQAASLKLDVVNLVDQRIDIAFLQNDELTFEQLAREDSYDPHHDCLFLAHRAKADEYHGKFRAAAPIWARFFDIIDPHLACFAWGLEEPAWAEALGGNYKESRKITQRVLRNNREQVDDVNAALALALAGDVDGAESLIKGKFADDRDAQDLWLPTIRAAIGLQKNRPSDAVRELQTISTYEKKFEEGNYMLPTYIHGQAYLANRQATEAAQEFKMILSNPGFTVESLTGSLAYLQLGRAEAMLGDTTAARASYEKFLTLWNNADSDLPIYKQAKTEYTMLHQ